MIINQFNKLQNFKKILTFLIIIFFSYPAFEFTQMRGTPQEADDRLAYEIKSKNFEICFFKKDCVGLNSFLEFSENKNIINYNSLEKKNRDLQRILYSYHPIYSLFELILKKIFSNYSKLILILCINLSILYAIYSFNIFYFDQKSFYLSSIILFFNPIYPGLISGYPFILATTFAIFSLLYLEKKKYIRYFITLIFSCLSHTFSLMFIGFFLILNYYRKYVEFNSIIKTLKDIKLHLFGLIHILILLTIYHFPIKFTKSKVILESSLTNLNYFSSLENFLDMIFVKILTISKFFYSFYLINLSLFVVAVGNVFFLVCLFFSHYKNLSLNIKTIFFSLLIFFIILMFFPNILILERVLPFYSIIFVSILIFSIFNLKKYNKIGFNLMIFFCLISIFSGSFNLFKTKTRYQENQDLLINNDKFQNYINYSNSLFIFHSTEAIFYKFLIAGIQKKNYFLNINNADFNLKKLEKKLEKKFDNIFLVTNSELIDTKKSTINSNLNKSITIQSKEQKISKIAVFSFKDTNLNINKKNFKIKGNKITELNLISSFEADLVSDDKVYILKVLNDKNNLINYLDIIANNKPINYKKKFFDKKLSHQEIDKCQINFYDTMYSSLIYKLSC